MLNLVQMLLLLFVVICLTSQTWSNLEMHSSTLLNIAVPVPYPHRTVPEGCLNTPKVNSTRAEPVWKCATADCFPMWARACQSNPYRNLDRCLNTNWYPAPLLCNMSHPGDRYKAYWMGTSGVRFGMLSTKLFERAQREPPWHGTHFHGMQRVAPRSWVQSIPNGYLGDMLWYTFHESGLDTHKANHPGMVCSRAAWYGTVWFASRKTLNAALNHPIRIEGDSI